MGQAMHREDLLAFSRRPSEIVVRVLSYLLFAALITVIVWFAGKLAYTASGKADESHWIMLPCITFIAFVLFLLLYTSRTVRQAFANRRAPLVLLDQTGVTLNRANPITVPWSEINGVSLERGFRGTTTLLRLDVSDPTVSEANAPGRVLDLRALAAQPTDLLSAIQTRLRSR